MATNTEKLNMMNIIINGTDEQIKRYYAKQEKRIRDSYDWRSQEAVVQQHERMLATEETSVVVEEAPLRIDGYKDTYISAKYRRLFNLLMKHGITPVQEDGVIYCKLITRSVAVINTLRKGNLSLEKIMKEAEEDKWCWISFGEGVYSLEDNSGEVYVAEPKEIKDMIEFMKVHYKSKIGNGLLVVRK